MQKIFLNSSILLSIDRMVNIPIYSMTYDGTALHTFTRRPSHLQQISLFTQNNSVDEWVSQWLICFETYVFKLGIFTISGLQL